jgi:DNA-binding MarR family transcriptional regulator
LEKVQSIRAFERQALSFGIQNVPLDILIYFAHLSVEGQPDPVSLKQIQTTTCYTAPTVKLWLDRLIKAEVLAIADDSADGRTRGVRLTTKGVTLVRKYLTLFQ